MEPLLSECHGPDVRRQVRSMHLDDDAIAMPVKADNEPGSSADDQRSNDPGTRLPGQVDNGLGRRVGGVEQLGDEQRSVSLSDLVGEATS